MLPPTSPANRTPCLISDRFLLTTIERYNVEFIDPPKDTKKTKWNDIVSTLKENQGEWALVGNYSPGVAAQIRQGSYKAFLGGWVGSEGDVAAYMQRHWELTTRKTEKGRTDLYVRWLG